MPELRPPAAAPIRLLIVDDNPSVRRSLALMLQAFEDLLLVGQAEDGEAALRVCAAAQPEVVLMDVLMPGMDGLAATRAITAGHPAVRVVAMTSFPDEGVRHAALTAGARQCLDKQVSIDELATAIRLAAGAAQ